MRVLAEAYLRLISPNVFTRANRRVNEGSDRLRNGRVGRSDLLLGKSLQERK